MLFALTIQCTLPGMRFTALYYLTPCLIFTMFPHMISLSILLDFTASMWLVIKFAEYLFLERRTLQSFLL